ncbi:MAG: MerR family transcriptional regulator [Pseudomonadota bacterium]
MSQHDEDAGSELPELEGFFPIRVVSQRTGVNTVTLRAWERRYGLLKPVRTPKGHRLYSEDDTQRVLRIVDWINRGVSIGRVRGLLERDVRISGIEHDEVDAAWETSDWQRYGARVQQAAAAFDEQRLDETVNETLSLYPFVTVCERLLNPLVENVGGAGATGAGSVPGDAAGRAFVEGYLRRKLASRMQFDAKQSRGAPVLIASLPGQKPEAVNHIALMTLAVGCIGMEVPVLLLEAALPVEDLLVAGERRRPAAIVLHGDAAQDTAAFARYLQRLVDARIAPVAVAGPAARIHEQLIADAGARALADESLAPAVRHLGLVPATTGNADRHE